MENYGKKMLASRAMVCYHGKTSHNMNTFAKSACLALLAAWAGSVSSMGQALPSAVAATNPITAGGRMPSRRIAGKILSVDTNTRTVALQGGAKAVFGITDQTKIIKARKPATINDLAPDQEVSGIERLDASGNWQAETLDVGAPRAPLEAPVPKVVIAPVSPSTFSVGEVKNWPRFAKRLSDHSDAVSALLWQRFSSQDQNTLKNFPASGPGLKPAQDAVIKVLNKVVAEPSIYDETRFQGISVRPETTALMKQSPTGPSLARLNRLLLEDAYPLDLSRIPNKPMPLAPGQSAAPPK
jgi:hypothetical protein